MRRFEELFLRLIGCFLGYLSNQRQVFFSYVHGIMKVVNSGAQICLAMAVGRLMRSPLLNVCPRD